MEPGRSDPYATAACYYACGRLPYPRALVDSLREELRLDGKGRLLDVGCGPGSITHLLAPLFAEAVGVDASGAMIEEAKAHAAPNERFAHLRAEDLPAGLGTFRVATLAQSFHWMDQPHVAPILSGMLEPEGALVHVGATTHRGDGDVPREEIDALIRRYLGPWPPGRSDERANLAAAGFDEPVEIEVPRNEVFSRSEDDVVASVYSLSYASPARFGERREAFERELRALLAGRTFTERPRAITLLVYRR
ncbi:MAG TPA: class I SAM-dependent methyltransferase [Gaiellaceae bacterium]|nr:class I SAM-dependent methyltransferase [Gaiellaceae bacterium]